MTDGSMEQANINQQAFLSQQSQEGGEKKEGAFQIIPLKQFDMGGQLTGGIEGVVAASLQSAQIPGLVSCCGQKDPGMFGKILGEKSRFNMNSDAGDMPGGRAEGMQEPEQPMVPPGGDMEAMHSAGQDLHQGGANEFQQVDTRQPEPPQQTPTMDQTPMMQGRGWG